MKVAAYQAPLETCHKLDALPRIREQIARCESLGVEILCCPEGILGGLADYANNPFSIALRSDSGQLEQVLAPLASDSVTTIVGFTEIDRTGHLYNAAAVFHRGSVRGIYRKHHPAIRRSVYTAGSETPLFTVGQLTFGIVICRDSAFPRPASDLIARGAAALFIPTNNGLPPEKSDRELVAEARISDIERAVANGVSVVRADVAGRNAGLVSHGAAGIIDQNGNVLAIGTPFKVGLVIADIGVAPRTSVCSS